VLEFYGPRAYLEEEEIEIVLVTRAQPWLCARRRE
jgi:hypothetical protein